VNDNAAVTLSNDFLVMLRPARTFRALAAQDARSSWGRVAGRAAFVALVIGAATSIAATGRGTLGLVASGTLCWSFVPALQIATASALVRFAPHRPHHMARSIELLFVGHGPYSLWLLLSASWLILVEAEDLYVNPYMTLSAAIPLAWTVSIVYAFCRTVLELSPRDAVLRTLLHQGLTAILLGGYIEFATRQLRRMVDTVTP
jgi:hypothetical protein